MKNLIWDVRTCFSVFIKSLGFNPCFRLFWRDFLNFLAELEGINLSIIISISL